MISDAKMRAHLLWTVHRLRDSNTGWVPSSDMNFGGLEAVALGRIRAICEQLAEAGLIHFKPLPGGPDGRFVGIRRSLDMVPTLWTGSLHRGLRWMLRN